MTFIGAAIGAGMGALAAETLGVTLLTGALGGAAVGSMVGGGINQANVAQDAAAQQAAATGNAANLQYLTGQNAIDFQKQMYQKQLELGAPYRETGYQGLTRLQQMMPSLTERLPSYLTSPITASDIQNMPGYQFAVQQGTGGAMQGMNVGGGGSNVQRAGQKFAIDYTMGTALPQLMTQRQNTYNNLIGERNQIYNTLAGVANLGQMQPGAGASAGQFGTNVANTMQTTGTNIGQLGVAGANALASGQIGAANAYGGAASQLGNAGLMYSLFSKPAAAGPLLLAG
jgi:hypothetical protein